tara:strand:- start:5007 stop:5177 length:171 start_codon:yes stop_codon:yes gene_type:complete
MKQSRLKTVWTFGFLITIITGFSICRDMNDVALIGVGALGGIISKYTHDETKRKSK